jgi:hypothetical protein
VTAWLTAAHSVRCGHPVMAHRARGRAPHMAGGAERATIMALIRARGALVAVTGASCDPDREPAKSMHAGPRKRSWVRERLGRQGT